MPETQVASERSISQHAQVTLHRKRPVESRGGPDDGPSLWTYHRKLCHARVTDGSAHRAGEILGSEKSASAATHFPTTTKTLATRGSARSQRRWSDAGPSHGRSCDGLFVRFTRSTEKRGT